MVHNILVPVDFSPASRHALKLAVGRAQTSGALLAILHVGRRALSSQEEALLGEQAEDLIQLHTQIATEEERRLNALVAALVPEDLPRTIIRREGYPPEEILAEVAEGGHDLVVMGVHGERGVLLGSVTERVVRRSPVPVLLTH